MSEYEFFALVLNGAIVPFIVWGAKYIVRKSNERHDRLEKLEQGMLATLRQQYLTTAFYYLEKGYMPFSISDSMEQIYQAYHGLGGNGSVTTIRESIIKLERRA